MKYSVAGATELKRNSNSHFIRDRILLLILQELCVNPNYDYRYDPKQKRNLQWRIRLHLVTESWSSSSSSWSPFDEPKCRKNSQKTRKSEQDLRRKSKVQKLSTWPGVTGPKIAIFGEKILLLLLLLRDHQRRKDQTSISQIWRSALMADTCRELSVCKCIHQTRENVGKKQNE